MNIEWGGGNVYADIGVSDAEEMLLKAQLASRIAGMIQNKGLTQSQSAKLLGIPQPKLSLMLRGRFRGISEVKMLECLARLGRDIQIVIGPEHAGIGNIVVV
ncbi:XRE family transcriptional regulator [Acidithiobacillus ferrooxidans]|jgi:predicted XRE-type DNA-binding protein|uniref:helix-turn-helix domain-containing protein n=1 Tax=Acidithiobacillus ferrooxidans TaxID=920 RepID=UPI000ACC21F7|nr:helix-turn-helix transcriptional regulator [Acidithiobacillus ferrooxidans]MBU2858448.1 XRE family transcriptional regulator [Acidithiobacillus ferrooxidans]MBU2861868.1 XRE family transcriptional regulator [Acidithiobacillus ferrooxidans]MCR2831050.1 helix-turn-helix domain-containing protein [Acidithiobacillus ferrooxidans]